MPVKIAARMGEKKVKGRKRHIATDTLGNMLTVQVHAANIADTSQGWDVCDQVAEKYDTIEAFSGDQGYSGTTVEFVENLLELRIDIAAKPSHGFKVISQTLDCRTHLGLGWGDFDAWPKILKSSPNLPKI